MQQKSQNYFFFLFHGKKKRIGRLEKSQNFDINLKLQEKKYYELKVLRIMR